MRDVSPGYRYGRSGIAGLRHFGHQSGAVKITAVATEAAPAALGPYSQAVLCGGILYVSGQLPVVSATGALVDGGIREQTRQLFANIRAILEAAGASLASVVKVTVFIAEWSDFGAFNEAYAELFAARRSPRDRRFKTRARSARSSVRTLSPSSRRADRHEQFASKSAFTQHRVFCVVRRSERSADDIHSAHGVRSTLARNGCKERRSFPFL